MIILAWGTERHFLAMSNSFRASMMTCPVLAFSLWTTRFLPCTQTQNFFFVDDSFQDNLLVSAFCHASSNNVAIPVMDNNFLAVFAGGLCLFFPLNNFLWSQTEESFFCQFAHSPILITALQFSLSARVLKRTLKKLVCVSVHLVPQKGHPSLFWVLEVPNAGEINVCT